MRKVKVITAEQFVFAAVESTSAAPVVVPDKVRELILAMPRLPKYEAWEKEILARPVSGREVSAEVKKG